MKPVGSERDSVNDKYDGVSTKQTTTTTTTTSASTKTSASMTTTMTTTSMSTTMTTTATTHFGLGSMTKHLSASATTSNQFFPFKDIHCHVWM